MRCYVSIFENQKSIVYLVGHIGFSLLKYPYDWWEALSVRVTRSGQCDYPEFPSVLRVGPTWEV